MKKGCKANDTRCHGTNICLSKKRINRIIIALPHPWKEENDYIIELSLSYVEGLENTSVNKYIEYSANGLEIIERREIEMISKQKVEVEVKSSLMQVLSRNKKWRGDKFVFYTDRLNKTDRMIKKVKLDLG